MGKWYAGVVHSHTNRSDGIYTPAELVKKAEEKGLDFLIITDHNQFCDDVPESDKILVIPGTELTTENGHTNIWGVKRPIDNFDCEEYEEWERKIALAKESGATVCINHPWCSNCGWHWPLEPEKADCVEIWNSPQHTDNMTCTSWWNEQLRKGKKIAAVGGSDFHRNYVVTDFLANPTTYVYAEECTQEAILEAIKAGHTTIAPGVGGTMIEISCGNKILGDTVKREEGLKAKVSVSYLKKGHTLKVIGKSGTMFQITALKSGPVSFDVPVKDTNFMSAQIEYTLFKPYEMLYAQVEKLVLHSKNSGKLPPFIYSQTSAIYFE